VNEVRWLDADEQRAWRSYVRATRLLDLAIQRDLACHGFSHDEYEILVNLSERSCRAARMSELAESVVNSRSRLTHTVGRLENRGYVRREASPDDRRGVICVMTDEGYAALETAAQSHVSGVRQHLLDQMSREEFLALGAALEGVRRHLEGPPESEPAPPPKPAREPERAAERDDEPVPAAHS
jgi:DNA-binding MarR family transcriptional regulator